MAREIPFIDLLASRGVEDAYLNTALRQTQKIYIPITFDGQEEKTFTKDTIIQSDMVNVKSLKNIEILISLESDVNFRAGLVLQSYMGTKFYNTAFYDWNTEDWVYGNVSGGNFYGKGEIVLRKLAPSELFIIGTHPNAYWLANFRGEGLRLRLKDVSDLGTNTATIRAWIVGERHV